MQVNEEALMTWGLASNTWKLIKPSFDDVKELALYNVGAIGVNNANGNG